MTENARFISVLNRVPRFQSVSVETQQAIASAASFRQFHTGQIIYVEGEPAESIYFLEEGWIKAMRMTREGREQAMMFLRPVEVFGDIAAFAGTAYPSTVIALEPVKAWAIHAKTMVEFFLRHPDLSLAVVRHMAERMLHDVNLVDDFSLRSVEARLARSLLQNAELQNGAIVVPRRQWATYDQMAARLGTVRDVLSRTLKSLEAERLLRVEKHAIILLDPKQMAERADR